MRFAMLVVATVELFVTRHMLQRYSIVYDVIALFVSRSSISCMYQQMASSY